MVQRVMHITEGLLWRTWLLRIAAAFVAVYGAYAFLVRGFTEYMFLRTQFVYCDFEAPLPSFFMDYLAVECIINFVLSIISVNQQSEEKPSCPYCNRTHVIKYGYRTGKQRFPCHDCKRTYMHSTNTIMSNSHYNQSVWADFICDTLCGVSLDKSAKKYGFSPQTAFNMRHKILMTLQDLFESNPVLLSGIAELDETFVLDCYKGSHVPKTADREPRRHGARAAKREISNEYIAICTGIQRDGGAIVAAVNRAKPSGKELHEIFCGHIAKDTLVLTDVLRSYNDFETLTSCTVVNVKREAGRGIFNLNTVNSLHFLSRRPIIIIVELLQSISIAIMFCFLLLSDVRTI
ncbi:MAG: IS1595 family transposase [Lachnospiraceae bacterium]|nr:IS1595 family transposase [Lachnospiraceae bacterium]